MNKYFNKKKTVNYKRNAAQKYTKENSSQEIIIIINVNREKKHFQMLELIMKEKNTHSDSVDCKSVVPTGLVPAGWPVAGLRKKRR